VFGRDCEIIISSFMSLFRSLNLELQPTRPACFPRSQFNKFFCFDLNVVLSITPRVTPIASARRHILSACPGANAFSVTHLQMQHAEETEALRHDSPLLLSSNAENPRKNYTPYTSARSHQLNASVLQNLQRMLRNFIQARCLVTR